MKKIISVLGLSLVMAANAFAQSSIEINSFAFVETVKMEKGKEVKSLEKASNVLPGQTVVFKNIVENKNPASVKDVVVNNIVPKEIIFVDASSSDDKNTQLEYSVDGTVFAKPEKLMIKDKETGLSRVAKAEEYTNIRWIYSQAIPVKGTLEFNYRGVLK